MSQFFHKEKKSSGVIEHQEKLKGRGHDFRAKF